MLLRGGTAQKVEEDLAYYQEHLLEYVHACKVLLESSGFKKKMDYVQSAIKAFGGTGRVHGCIVDIDFYCHVFIDPATCACTWYSASSVVSKYVYSDPRHLLVNSELTQNSWGLVKSYNDLLPSGPISEDTTYVSDTSYVRISNRVYSLCSVVYNGLVKRWEPDVISAYKAVLCDMKNLLGSTDIPGAEYADWNRQCNWMVENEENIVAFGTLYDKIKKYHSRWRSIALPMEFESLNSFRDFNPDSYLTAVLQIEFEKYNKLYFTHKRYCKQLQKCYDDAVKDEERFTLAVQGTPISLEEYKRRYLDKVEQSYQRVKDLIGSDWTVTVSWKYTTPKGRRTHTDIRVYTWTDITGLYVFSQYNK